MKYNEDRVDNVVLALLYLNMTEDDFGIRAWKSLPWSAMDRLYKKGYISDPQGKGKSVAVSEEARQRAEALFRQYFGEGAGEGRQPQRAPRTPSGR